MPVHSGGCQCGAVRFQAQGPLRDVVFCHCSQCRRQTGLYYAATSVPSDALDVTGHVTWYAASPHALRGFCANCGSALFWELKGGATISIMAGAFDDPAILRGGLHIMVADKADFYAISDGLPQFPAGAPGVETAG
jgi:hypothetical protein